MKSSKTKALVIRSVNYRESDRIVSFFTEGLGRISGIARGARKSLKRFGGCLEPFTLIDLTVRFGKGELLIIEEAKVSADFRPIKEDILKVSYGSYMVELTEAMVAEVSGASAAEIFNCLLSGLEHMSLSKNPEEVVRGYEVRMLGVTGYMPAFLVCSGCGSGIFGGDHSGRHRDGALFSVSRGGVVCDKCNSESREKTEFVSLGTLKTLSSASDKRVCFTSNALEESGRVIPAFIAHHIGKRLKSLDFLEKIKGGS